MLNGITPKNLNGMKKKNKVWLIYMIILAIFSIIMGIVTSWWGGLLVFVLTGIYISIWFTSEYTNWIYDGSWDKTMKAYNKAIEIIKKYENRGDY